MLNDNHPPSSSLTYPGLPTFHSHISPPNSPSTKSHCYEHKDQVYMGESIFCCCYPCPGNRSTSILATVGVCLMVLAYTLMGAFIFMALESGLDNDTAVAASKHKTDMIDDKRVESLRVHTVDQLWIITENLNILYKENWTKMAEEEVLVFQEALVQAIGRNGRNYEGWFSDSGFYHHSQHRWSFSSSFLYSLTLITTIGYGSVAPKTSWGKLVTIVYAMVGIPLMFLYLSTTGDLLARSFRKLYAKICGISPKKPQCPCSKNVRVPVPICLMIVLIYICSGAIMFHRLENWSLLEGSYFCFTSLGTIGFGDLLPGRQKNRRNLALCLFSLHNDRYGSCCNVLQSDPRPTDEFVEVPRSQLRKKYRSEKQRGSPNGRIVLLTTTPGGRGCTCQKPSRRQKSPTAHEPQ